MTDRPKRPAPKSVRMKPEDRRLLASRAAAVGMSENAYMVWRALHDDKPPPRSRRNPRGGDTALLTALLAMLGQSNIANNLNQLVRLAHSGSLVLTPEIEAEMRDIAAELRNMRDMLVAGMRLSEGAP